MNLGNPPFYPNEIITGHVVELRDWYAVIQVRDWHLPIEKQFISWDLINNARQALDIGQRIQAVVHPETIGTQQYSRSYQFPKLFWHGYWLNRLPLLESPEDKYKDIHPNGSMIDIEFMAYINFYTAMAKLPDGTIIELLQRDIHPGNHAAQYAALLQPCQQITIRVKQFKGRTLLGKRLE